MEESPVPREMFSSVWSNTQGFKLHVFLSSFPFSNGALHACTDVCLPVFWNIPYLH